MKPLPPICISNQHLNVIYSLQMQIRAALNGIAIEPQNRQTKKGHCVFLAIKLNRLQFTVNG